MLKRTRLKRVSLKQRLKIEQKKEITKRDHETYREIWKDRPHTCIESGRGLGKEPLTTYFHHLLKKETFPQYRWEKWNIVILSPEMHGNAESDLDKVPKVKELYLEALEKHKKIKEKYEQSLLF